MRPGPISKPRPRLDGTSAMLGSIATGDAPLVAGRGDHVGNQTCNAGDVGLISGDAEARDDQSFGRHDDDVLPGYAAGIAGIARHSERGAVARTLAVAAVGPEPGSRARPGAWGERGRIADPPLRQDAPATDDAIVEIE